MSVWNRHLCELFSSKKSKGEPPPVAHAKRALNWPELTIAAGFAAVSAVAHLVWNPLVEYWQFIATTLVFIIGLTVWLFLAWRRLGLFITRFYCVAVIFDTAAEGLLQPFHHCTMDNLFCTGRLFLIFFAGWLLFYPLERWLAMSRSPAIKATPGT